MFFCFRYVARLEELLHEWKLVNSNPLPPAPRVIKASNFIKKFFFEKIQTHKQIN